MAPVAVYVRVSTEDQSLDRQLTATHEYAQDELGAELAEIETFKDKSTGTNTERDGYHNLMDSVAEQNFDAVVVHSVSRISRSIRDLDRTVETIVEENGTALHIISEGFNLEPGNKDPYQNALFRLLGVFAQLEAEMAQVRTKEGIQTRMANEEYHHGPAPLGFKKNDGRLIEADGFDRVRAVLDEVAAGELSKRKAAQELDTSRRTINRALDRKELYNL